MDLIKWKVIILVDSNKIKRRLPIIVYARNKLEAEIQVDSIENYTRIGPAVKYEEKENL